MTNAHMAAMGPHSRDEGPSGLDPMRTPKFLADQQLWEIDANRLRLEKLIAGESSKSEVWAGTLSDLDTGSRHPVAVKRLSLSSAGEFHNVQREIEILSLTTRRCHSCARFWGWCVDSAGMVCVIMTRYEQSLASLLRSKEGGRLSLPEVRRYGMQIARAIAELHEQHIVLSDLKPANVLLDDYKQCVLADFGISKLLTSRSKELEGLHGTFNYMSPESFDPDTFGKISTKSDSWSFACCIVEMATGKVPWAGTSMSAICFKVTSSRESPAIPHELPSHVHELLSRCFSFQSEARPSFKEIFAAFNSDWGQSASKARQVRSFSLEPTPLPARGDQSPPDELEQLRTEKQAWALEREGMVARLRGDAGHIAELQHNLAEHQSVNEVLQGQLKLMVKGMQAQQAASHKQRSLSLEGAAPFEVQLAGCQDALNQCMKQKEVAKEMLRKESTRTAALSLELNILREQRQRMHAVLEALAAEACSAQQDVAWLQSLALHDYAQHSAWVKQDPARLPHTQALLAPLQGRAARDLEMERKIAYLRPAQDTRQRLPVAHEAIRQPHSSQVDDWDSDSRTSRDDSEDGVPEDSPVGGGFAARSPLDPREDWLWKVRLNKRHGGSRDGNALSAASTPALSVQSSWDSGSSTARVLAGIGRDP